MKAFGQRSEGREWTLPSIASPPRSVLRAAVALLAAVPWVSLLGWVVSVWVMARVVESTARGERRMPPLPGGPRVREELDLFLRALAVTSVVLLPLWAVLAAALVRRSDPDLPGPELVMALGLFGTLVRVALLLPALALLARGASVSMALNRAILARALSYGLQVLVAFVTGLAAMPTEEKEEPLPAGWTLEKS